MFRRRKYSHNLSVMAVKIIQKNNMIGMGNMLSNFFASEENFIPNYVKAGISYIEQAKVNNEYQKFVYNYLIKRISNTIKNYK